MRLIAWELNVSNALEAEQWPSDSKNFSQSGWAAGAKKSHKKHQPQATGHQNSASVEVPLAPTWKLRSVQELSALRPFWKMVRVDYN